LEVPMTSQMLRTLPSLFVAICFAQQYDSQPYYKLSKRTLSSSDGGLDQAFWNKYFGPTDPASTHGGCLDRWLQHAAPDNIGMHFPTSSSTPDVPVNANGSNDTMHLADWDAFRIQLHAKAVDANKKSTFHDYATAFYTPDLGPHCSKFASDGVPFLARQYSFEGVVMFVAIVTTPGNGHTLEIQAPACLGCSEQTFAPFGSEECEGSHRLANSLEYYADAWRYATGLEGWNSTLANSSLPTPLLMQVRSAVVDIEEARKYLQSYVPKAAVKDDLRALNPDGGTCSVVEIMVTTAPFAAQRHVTNYSVPLRWVQNSGGWSEGHNWAEWTNWTARLHRDYVGEGWGYDRLLDYHIKLNTQADDAVTQANVSLDHFAALHTQQGLRYHPFNTSQNCPGTFIPTFGGGFMMYSEGIEGTSGFEFWGPIDRSFFAQDVQLYGWNGCSPSMGCMYRRPDPMCSVHTGGLLRARVPSDWPTNLATLNLSCDGDELMHAVIFASFGNPSGTCEEGFKSGSCDAANANATKVVTALCLGKQHCVVPATPLLYGGDVCPQEDWPVTLAVEMACSAK